MTTRRKDPELARRLRTAGVRGTVEAVVRLNDEPAGAVAPGRLEGRVRRLVRRAERETGHKASDLHVFRHLASFVICGSPALVRALMGLDEVASAVANQRPQAAVAPLPGRPRKGAAGAAAAAAATRSPRATRGGRAVRKERP